MDISALSEALAQLGFVAVRVIYAIAISFAVEQLVEYFFGFPLEEYAPDVDRRWLRFVALPLAGTISWFSDWSIFTEAMELHPVAARLLTAAIVGAGPEIIHRIVKEPQVPSRDLDELLDWEDVRDEL